MFPAPFGALLDANVLYPMTLRDTLLRAAAHGYYQLLWSHQILEEARRNLVAHGRVTEVQATHLFDTMQRAFPESMVKGFEGLIEAMPNAPGDRHVTAAAVVSEAQVIVTMNLKDFRELPEGIEAQSPDEFLSDLMDLDPDGFVELLREQAAALKNPPFSFEQLLGGLARVVPRFVGVVQGHLGDPLR